MQRLLLSLIFTQLISAFALTKRITDGMQVNPLDYPFMVSLEYDQLQRCAGTLLSPSLLITAAHCTIGLDPLLWSASFIQTTVDSPFLRVNISQIYTHPSFNESSYSNDVALFVLSEPVTDQRVSIAVLDDGSYGQPTQQVTAIGYGEVLDSATHKLETSETLNGIQMQLVDNQVCTDYFTDKGWTVDTSMQCMAGKGGSCNGDSGGPVFVALPEKIVVVGIISWGLPDVCGMNKDPSVNTNVASAVSQSLGETLQTIGEAPSQDPAASAAIDSNTAPEVETGVAHPADSARAPADPEAASALNKRELSSATSSTSLLFISLAILSSTITQFL